MPPVKFPVTPRPWAKIPLIQGTLYLYLTMQIRDSPPAASSQLRQWFFFLRPILPHPANKHHIFFVFLQRRASTIYEEYPTSTPAGKKSV